MPEYTNLANGCTMVIKRRDTFIEAPKPKWTHRIECKHFTANFQVNSGDKVIAADPVIHWAIGQRLDRVRELSNQRGYDLKEIK